MECKSTKKIPCEGNKHLHHTVAFCLDRPLLYIRVHLKIFLMCVISPLNILWFIDQQCNIYQFRTYCFFFRGHLEVRFLSFFNNILFKRYYHTSWKIDFARGHIKSFCKSNDLNNAQIIFTSLYFFIQTFAS